MRERREREGEKERKEKWAEKDAHSSCLQLGNEET
jgi:hypothetical protein